MPGACEERAHLLLLRQRLHLSLAVGHPDQVAKGQLVHAVAGGADLLVDLGVGGTSVSTR